MKYNPLKIERKWQRTWEKQKIYHTQDKAKGKPKARRPGRIGKNFYHLVMFPYPSGDLHMGHWFNYGPGDVYARFKRMQGLNVMSPIGFDAFGLPAENAAIQRNLDPKSWTYNNIKVMRKQLDSIGTSFDWSREVITSEPDYYKWTQWIFLKLYQAGLATKKKVLANWCPKDKTIIANEQVIDGKCERDGSPVEQRLVEQWVFKITEYAQKLLDGLNPEKSPDGDNGAGKIDWPETTKILQENWIGRSEGASIKFKIKNEKVKSKDLYIEVFTTRPDTIFGATFMVLAPEHELVSKITRDQFLGKVNNYLEQIKSKTELERLVQQKDKTGVFTGAYAVNPTTKEKIPIWISDFVLSHYGGGAIMAVPAHDQRDFEFAKLFKLPIKPVVKPQGKEWNFSESAYESEGVLIDSGKFSGFNSQDGKEEIIEWLAKRGLAERQINYRLHDWIISRQRYWGAPIPIIYCSKCGTLPVLEKDLPVELPKIKDYKPAGGGKSPLAKAKDWVNAECWKCFGPAERETDTMDTFVDSAWYFLRYVDPKNKNEPFDKLRARAWLPVNMYIGGQEHATKHLLYARFITKVLHDLGYLHFDEPFISMRHQGIILGPDGQKMSKSRGNVVNPDEYVKKYGADTVRMYLCFMGPYEQGGPWNPKAIVGVYRFLNRAWNMAERIMNYESGIRNKNSELEKQLHKAIKKVGEDIENLRFNTAVSELMKLLNEMEKSSVIRDSYFVILLKLLSPFAPHLTEELWSRLHSRKSATMQLRISRFHRGSSTKSGRDSQSESGQVSKSYKSIHLEPWPKYDPKLIEEETIDLVIQVNGRTRDIIKAPRDLTESQARELALTSEKIKKYLAQKEIKKLIYIPNKLTNIVV